MPTNLTGSSVASTYNQLLHVDNGPSATEKVVHSGTGVATALKVGTGSVSVDNIKIDGNTISSTDTNGNISLAPDGSGTVAFSKAAITGGTITGVSISSLTGDLAVADGGTGASTASSARTNLGLGTIATQNADAVTITGGSVKATTALGYETGVGGAETQLTSKSTGVTLDKICGTITMNNASLAHQESVSFTLTNSTIAATDLVVVNVKSGGTAGAYLVSVGAVAAGSCSITLFNAQTSGNLSEAVVLSFAVIKAVAV